AVLQALEKNRRLLTTIVVNNETDTPVAGLIDLGEAIAQANANAGDDTMKFDKKVFAKPKTVTLGGTQLDLIDTKGTTTIIGPDAGVTISGVKLSRVFQVEALVSASISGVTITGGTENFDYGGG